MGCIVVAMLDFPVNCLLLLSDHLLGLYWVGEGGGGVVYVNCLGYLVI